ncbi:MAG: putative sugar nucleotidyl transferase, partial [Bacteroidota bacterium]|nr:putative sugar nucleotidyl transferase [Bacteroidota bacterium]
MNYILFDGPNRNALLPFTYTRPVADLRMGIFTIREKWEAYLGLTTTTITEDYLSEKFPMVEFSDNIMINAAFLPNLKLVELIQNLGENEAVFEGEQTVAFRVSETQETIDFSQFKIHRCPASTI